MGQLLHHKEEYEYYNMDTMVFYGKWYIP